MQRDFYFDEVGPWYNKVSLEAQELYDGLSPAAPYIQAYLLFLWPSGSGLLQGHTGLLLSGKTASCGTHEPATGQGSGAGWPPLVGRHHPTPNSSNSGLENASS